MAELPINQIHNVFKKYRQMQFVNPYRFGIPTPPVPTANIISYWKFEDNFLDSVGTNHGTNYLDLITFENGTVGKRAKFSNLTRTKVNIPDSNSLSFTNGTNDLPFSISIFCQFYAWSGSGNWLINRRDSTTTGQQEWQIIYYSDRFIIALFNYNTGGSIAAEVITGFTVNTNRTITVSYDGSGTKEGLNIYVDNIIVNTKILSGVYTKMPNTISKTVIGERGWQGTSEGSHNGTIDEIVVFNKAVTSAEHLAIKAKFESGQHLI